MSSLSLLIPTLTLIPLVFLTITMLIITRRKTNHRAPRHQYPLPPGPTPWPILGSLPEMWLNRPASLWLSRVMDDFNTDIACVRLGNSYVILVRSPELAREFLKKHDAVFASRPQTVATRILTRGYLTTVFGPLGDQWKKMRRLMVSDVFSSSNVRWLLHKRNLEADNLVRFIFSHCSNSSKGGLVNVRTAAQLYSSGVLRRMLFKIRHFGKGRENGGPGFEEEEYIGALFTIIKHVYAFNVSDYLPWLECLDLDDHKKNIVDAMRVVAKYHDPIVNDRIRRRRGSEAESKPEDLLDVFISLKDSKGNPLLSNDEIRAQIMEASLSLDVPIHVMEWALSEMLNKPEIMKKVVAELDVMVGKDRLIEESDIPNLPYLTACAREVFRLHPISHFNLPHTSTADCIVANYFIPKGSSVIIDRTRLGRNPKVWEEPLRFDPGRHMPAGGAVDLAEDDLRFVTFSTGRRRCTSVGLGSNMIMMLLGRVVQGFSWEIPDGLDKIDLSESSLSEVRPLLALAKPRLNAHVYQSLHYC